MNFERNAEEPIIAKNIAALIIAIGHTNAEKTPTVIM